MSDSRPLVAVPAHNEAPRIRRTLEELAADFPEADVLVVDDGSTDDTARIARACGATVVSLPFNLGYAGALQTAFKYAVAAGYAHLVQFDADGQHIAAEARRIYREALARGTDVLIGSRFLSPSDYRHSSLRRAGTSLLCRVLRWTTGAVITDPTSGMQVLSRRAVVSFAPMHGYPEYPDANMILGCLSAGYALSEIAVSMRAREGGESMHGGILRPMRYMSLVLYTTVMMLLRARRTPGRQKGKGAP